MAKRSRGAPAEGEGEFLFGDDSFPDIGHPGNQEAEHLPPARQRLKEWDYHCRDPLRQEAHQALKQEYAAAIKKAHLDKVVLERGIFQGKTGDRHRYRFQVSALAAQSIQPDKPHSLQIHGRAVDGAITEVGDQHIEVGLAENVGQVLPHLEVIFDLTVLVDLVDRRVCEIDKDPSRFSVSIANSLLTDLKWPDLAPLPSLCDHKQRGDGRPLDRAQLEAVQAVLCKPFCLIWGPPGTGKTHTLLGVLAELLANGKRVLFASNTNSAIDNLLEKILPDKKSLYGVLDDAREQGIIVRLGAQAKADVKAEFSPDAIAKKKSIGLRDKLAELHKQVEAVTHQRDDTRAALSRFTEAQTLVSKWCSLQAKIDALPEPDEMQSDINALRARRESYLSSMHQILPTLVDQFRGAMGSYRCLIKEREAAASASLLLADREAVLQGIQQTASVLGEQFAQLQASWFRRTFRKSQIHALRMRIEANSRENAAAEKAVQAAHQALRSATLEEANVLTQVRGALAGIGEIRSRVLEAVQHAGDYLTADRPWRRGSLWERLFTRDRNLLATVIGEDLIGPVAALVSVGWTKTEHDTDAVVSRFDREIREAEHKIELAQRIMQEMADICTDYADAENFLAEHEEEADGWQNRLQESDGQIRRLSEDTRLIEGQLGAIEDRVIGDARMVAMTLVKASYDKRLIDQRYDVLVVEEFSMASLPQLYCVSATVNERIVLCGDHLQLEPIVVTKLPVGLKWLGCSFYDWHEGQYGERDGQCRVLRHFRAVLDVQRRMPPEVSALVRPWYVKEGNDLKDDWRQDGGCQSGKMVHPLLASPIVILDTTSTNAYSSRSPSRSHYNLIHAGIVGEICRELVEVHGVEPQSIRCITPYRDQAALTRAVLRQLFTNKDTAERLEASATTIHQSQGRQAPIVIYDLTDGVQHGLTYFHKRREPNLLNVALTRTQANLIIVCAYEKMRNRLAEIEGPPALAEVLKIMEQQKVLIVDACSYAERVFKRVTAADLLDIATVPLTEAQKNSILVLDSRTYYDALAGDLRRAEESVLIVCPFISRSRMARLGPLLKDVVVRSQGKVTIQVITRPPESMFDREKVDSHRGAALRKVLDEMVDLGAYVVLAPNAHGKLVVIDNRVNYWGSLNPLSFRDTDEINTRLDAPELSKRLIQLARSGRSWPYRPSNETYSDQEILSGEQELASSELRKLGWRLAGLYGMFRALMMWGKTIEALVTHPPQKWSDYGLIEEFRRRNCVLRNHLDEIEDIIWPIRGRRLPAQDKPTSEGDKPSLFG